MTSVDARRRGPVDKKRPPTVHDTRGMAASSQEIPSSASAPASLGARPKRPKLTDQLQDGNGETAKASSNTTTTATATSSKRSHHSSPFFTPINTLRKPQSKAAGRDTWRHASPSVGSGSRRKKSWRDEDDSRSPSPSVPVALSDLSPKKFSSAPKLKYAPKPVARNRSVVLSKVRTRSQAEKESCADDQHRTLTCRSHSANNVSDIPRWTSSLIYPSTGRKRAEVEFRDLERLNDNEFLNDNIIGLYIRFLEHHVERRSPDLAKRIYFFNSYFFASLTNTPRGSRDTINYQSVQKWTRNVDLFSYDFVVVPIHDKAHWFLAIICNLPRLLQDPPLQEAQQHQQEEGEDTDANEKQKAQASDSQSGVVVSETTTADGAKDRDEKPINATTSVIEIPGSPVNVVKAEGHEEHVKSETSHQQNHRAELDVIASSDDELAVQQMTPLRKKIPIETEDQPTEQRPKQNSIDIDEIPAVDGEEKDQTSRSGKPEQPTQQQSDGSQTPARTPQTKEKQTYSKRKKRPPPTPQKFNLKQPIIITLDSLGCARSPVSRALRDYLWDECSTKRNIDLNTREIKGITAKQIPLQQNFSDCGLYLLAYLERFVQDPDAFIAKLLRREMNVDVDWPELDSRELRRQLRSFIVDLHNEQERGDQDDESASRKYLVDVTPLHILLPPQGTTKRAVQIENDHGQHRSEQRWPTQ